MIGWIHQAWDKGYTPWPFLKYQLLKQSDWLTMQSDVIGWRKGYTPLPYLKYQLSKQTDWLTIQYVDWLNSEIARPKGYTSFSLFGMSTSKAIWLADYPVCFDWSNSWSFWQKGYAPFPYFEYYVPKQSDWLTIQWVVNTQSVWRKVTPLYHIWNINFESNLIGRPPIMLIGWVAQMHDQKFTPPLPYLECQ